jgi:integrase
MPRGRPNQGPRLVLHKRPGWSQAIYYVRWHERNHTRELSTSTGDRREAESFLGRWLVERGGVGWAQRAGPHHPHEMSIADALSIYAVKHAPLTTDPARIGFAIQALLGWWGERCIDAVNPESCAAYARSRGVKPGSVARELSVLSAALRYCQKNGHLTIAPFVQMPRRQPGKERWLTRSEAAKLLWESRRGARLVLPLFLLIALYTGARTGAILGLRWSQVDLVRGRIDFNEPGRPITNKRRPIIPIPRQLLWFLRAAHRRSHSSWVVVSNDGAKVKFIRQSFTTARKRAGLGADVTPHVLRHTAGTWLAQSGVDLYQVAGWLGHTNTRTTELYAHHSPDHFAAAKRAMERGRDRIPPTFPPT